MGSRGELTKEVKTLSKGLFGHEIDVRELRLLPYLQYLIMNSENVDPAKVNHEDRKILMNWQKEGWLESPASNLMISSDFYDTMCKILKISYCQDSIL